MTDADLNDARGIAMVGKEARQPVGDARTAFGHCKQRHAAIRSDAPMIEAAATFPAQRAGNEHGGKLQGREETGQAHRPKLLSELSRLPHARQSRNAAVRNKSGQHGLVHGAQEFKLQHVKNAPIAPIEEGAGLS